MARTSDASFPMAAAALAGAGLWLASRIFRRRRLEEKVVLIAGASRGLGLELARQIGARGARVAICARDRAVLDRAARDLERRGIPALAEVCDLTRPEDVARFVERVERTLGPIDVAIHNAGRIEVGPAEHMTEADHRASMDLHYWAPLRLAEAVLPQMRRRGSGHLVLVSSIAGAFPVPHLLPYTASKHALVGLAHGLRLELARYGITVTTVMPGLLRTGGARHASFKGRHQQEYAWFGIADSLPGLATSTRRAARRIRRAIETRNTEVVIGLPAKIGRLAHGLAPRLTHRALAAAGRLLPSPGGLGEASMPGHASESALTRSPLMAFGRMAERRFNQVPDEDRR